MAPLKNDTRCPHCGSREFWPARARGLERLFGGFLPYVPFRCRACLRRYVVPQPWVRQVRLYAGALVVTAALIVLVHGLFFSGGWLADEATGLTSEQAVSGPAESSADGADGNASEPSESDTSPARTASEDAGNGSVASLAPAVDVRSGAHKDALAPPVLGELETIVKQVPGSVESRGATVAAGGVEGSLSFSFYADVPKGGAVDATQ